MVEKQEKFKSLKVTEDGSPRGLVPFTKLKTLWLNSGTLCNLACSNCYIESSPKNDSLVFLSMEDVRPFVSEILDKNWQVDSINITGGEPFINPHIFDILELLLENNFNVLVLTNAYQLPANKLEKIKRLDLKYKDQFSLRISLDHYTSQVHEKERGKGSFSATMENFQKLHRADLDLSIAGRSLIKEDLNEARAGYQNLLNSFDINIDLNPNNLVIFPEMENSEDVPEISMSCFSILNVKPTSLMCSTERMIVKRKGAEKAAVLACTLIAYDSQFELGGTLEESFKHVYLNHSFCSKFCVLGGASCSG